MLITFIGGIVVGVIGGFVLGWFAASAFWLMIREKKALKISRDHRPSGSV